MSKTRNPYGLAIVEALRAATLTLLPLLVVAIITWSLAGSRSGALADAVHGGTWIWLASHKVLLHLSLPPGDIAGVLWFTPLGFLLFPLVVLRGACQRMRSQKNYRGGVTLLATCYGLILGVLSLISASHTVRPNPLSGVLSGIILTLLAALTLQVGGVKRAKSQVSIVFRNALLNIVGLGAMAIISFLTALVLHFSQLLNLYTVLRTGIVGFLLITIAMLLAIPNAIVLTMSYLTGAGFAIGSGTLFAPFAVNSAQIPALPILAALPATTSGLTHALPAIVLGWTIYTGFRAAQGATSLKERVQDGALHGVMALVMLTLLNLLAGGSLLGGRLSAVGASPLRLLIFAGSIFIVGGAIGAAMTHLAQSGVLIKSTSSALRRKPTL